MSYSTSQQQQYTEPNKPYWLIWVAVILLSLVALSVCGQCDFQTIQNAAFGDRICCDEIEPAWGFPAPNPLPGYENTYKLSITRPNIAQSFITSLGQLSGRFVKWEWQRPDGLYEPVFTLSLCPPQLPPTPASNQLINNSITPELLDIPFTYEYLQWIELNYSEAPILVRLEWCRNNWCREWRGSRVEMGSDTRILIPYKWQKIRVYDRDGLIAILELL